MKRLNTLVKIKTLKSNATTLYQKKCIPLALYGKLISVNYDTPKSEIDTLIIGVQEFLRVKGYYSTPIRCYEGNVNFEKWYSMVKNNERN